MSFLKSFFSPKKKTPKTRLVLTSHGKKSLHIFEKKYGIFPNYIYFISALKNGKSRNRKELENELKTMGINNYEECETWAINNNFIRITN